MIIPYRNQWPVVHQKASVALTADVIGKVSIQAGSSIWYRAVLRGDVDTIHIGAGSNLQDGVVVHVDKDAPVWVGDNVTVGHSAILHGCYIDSHVIIGMGAIILNGAKIGSNSIVGAGALVTGGKVFEPGSLIMGSPAKVVRALSTEEIDGILDSAHHYQALAESMMCEGKA